MALARTADQAAPLSGKEYEPDGRCGFFVVTISAFVSPSTGASPNRANMTCSTAFGRLAKAQRVRRFDGGAKTVRAPQADECAAAKLRPQPGGSYSITSSGLASSVGGTARPSAFAVLSGLKFVRSLVG